MGLTRNRYPEISPNDGSRSKKSSLDRRRASSQKRKKVRRQRSEQDLQSPLKELFTEEPKFIEAN